MPNEPAPPSAAHSSLLEPLITCQSEQAQLLITSVDQSVQDHLNSGGAANLYVAFSGGLDSTALLLATLSWLVSRNLEQGSADTQATLVCLHAKHGLQDEDTAWVAHARKVCAALDVPIEVAALTVPPGNVEAAARQARYEFFARHVAPGGLLLLAHHADDQEETLLQRLFTGRGMLPTRHAGVQFGIRFARPFMHLSKLQLRDYVREVLQLLVDSGCVVWEPAWIEDPSNADLKLDRNYLRHEILPRVHQQWPAAAQSLQRVATANSAQHLALQDTLRAILADSGDGADTTPFTNQSIKLQMLPADVQAAQAWLRSAVEVCFRTTPTDRAVREFLRERAAGQDAVLRVNDACEVRIYNERLHFVRMADLGVTEYSVGQAGRIPWQYGEVVLEEVDIHTIRSELHGNNAREAGTGSLADTICICAPGLRIVPRQGGECVIDAKGISRAVKDLLHEAAVPVWLRRQYPLLVVGDEVVCVPSVWSQSNDLAHFELGQYATFLRASFQP